MLKILMPKICQIHNTSFSEYVRGFNLDELILSRFKTGCAMSAFILHAIKARDSFKN